MDSFKDKHRTRAINNIALKFSKTAQVYQDFRIFKMNAFRPFQRR